MKNLLVLGGTQFVGRRFVERLLASPEHSSEMNIVLCNRGKSNVHLFPELERIVLDRERDDMRVLCERDWDYVVDFSAYYPLSLDALVNQLKGHVGRYIFISTLSVFSFDGAAEGRAYNEDSETSSCSEEQMKDTSMMSYGARKAECERVLERATWLDSISLRPSLIYGRYDWTDRFYYWLYRSQKCSEFLIPESGRDLITLTELEDLCTMITGCLRVEKHLDVYNATTHSPMTIAAFIAELQALSSHASKLQTISLEQCDTLGIQLGADLPMWFGIPLNINNEAILRDLQMECRPFHSGLSEAMQRADEAGWPLPKTGMSIEREAEVTSLVRGAS